MGSHPRHRPLVRLLLAFAAIYIFWGSTFLAIRFAVVTIPPLLLMGTRHLGAGSLLYLWQRRRRQWNPEPGLWIPALISGAFCFLGCHSLLAWAELRVPSGLAALLAATLPMWMVLLARLRGQESAISPRVIVGIALGFGGVAVLIPIGLHGQWMERLSTLAILVSELFWAIGAIYARGVRTRTSISTFASMQMLCGGVLLWIVGLGLGEGARLQSGAFTMRAVLSLLFLIVFGSAVTYTAYVWLLQVSSPALVSTHSYINPVVAVFLGWAAAGEAVTWRTITGTAIILMSVGLVSVRWNKKAVEAAA